MDDTFKVHEGVKKSFLSKKYMLGISCVIDEDHSVNEIIRHVNEAMVNWFKIRNFNIHSLVFVYIAGAPYHEEIMGWTETLVNQEFEWISHLKKLKAITLVIADPTTGKRIEFDITQS